MSRPIICLDFDGTIHLYSRGWQDGSIYDGIVPGFFAWAIEANKRFTLVVYSSRSKTLEGRSAMLLWLIDRWSELGNDHQATGSGTDAVLAIDDEVKIDLQFSAVKPPAFVTIDDRAITFTGRWDELWLQPDVLSGFKPWNDPVRPSSLPWRAIEMLPDEDMIVLARCADGRVMVYRSSILRSAMNPSTPDHLQFPATQWLEIR